MKILIFLNFGKNLEIFDFLSKLNFGGMRGIFGFFGSIFYGLKEGVLGGRVCLGIRRVALGYIRGIFLGIFGVGLVFWGFGGARVNEVRF